MAGISGAQFTQAHTVRLFLWGHLKRIKYATDYRARRSHYKDANSCPYCRWIDASTRTRKFNSPCLLRHGRCTGAIIYLLYFFLNWCELRHPPRDVNARTRWRMIFHAV